MPKISGFDLLQKIRLRPSPDKLLPPFIFLSGMKDDEHIITGAHLLADDYLIKPVSFRILLAKINAALGRSNLYQNNSWHISESSTAEAKINIRTLIEDATATVIMQKENMFKQIAVSFESGLPLLRVDQELLSKALTEILECIVRATEKTNKTFIHASYDYGNDGMDITITGKNYSLDFLHGVMSLPSVLTCLIPQGIGIAIITVEKKLALQIKLPENLVG
jgi:DNA-binding response OmpR family regulator